MVQLMGNIADYLAIVQGIYLLCILITQNNLNLTVILIMLLLLFNVILSYPYGCIQDIAYGNN